MYGFFTQAESSTIAGFGRFRVVCGKAGLQFWHGFGKIKPETDQEQGFKALQ